MQHRRIQQPVRHSVPRPTPKHTDKSQHPPVLHNQALLKKARGVCRGAVALRPLCGFSTASQSKKNQALCQENKNKTKKVSKVKQFQLIKDLDLSTTASRKGLKDFVNEANPTSNINITTTIIYYMQQIYEYVGDINGDIIFTCWRELGSKIPNNLTGNLRDICSSKYGYANVENGNYSITTRGINLVEHTLLEGQNR